MFKTKRAFTIVELMLVMTFLSTLFVTIAVLVKFLTATYQRGISVNSVNSAGRHIIDDISKSIAASPARATRLICRDKLDSGTNAFNECVNDDAYRYSFYQKYGTVADVKDGSNKKQVPLYGAFCTGRYSYIWNSGYFFNKNYKVEGDIKPVVLREYNGSDDKKTIRLLRVQDPRRNVCAGHVNDGYTYKAPTSSTAPMYSLSGGNKLGKLNNDHESDVETKRQDATEIIGDGEGAVAIYDLRLFQPAIHNMTNQSFYSGTMILATTMGKVDITGLGQYCQEPSTGFETEFNYCALNKFNFAVRSLGKMRDSEQLEGTINYEKKRP